MAVIGPTTMKSVESFAGNMLRLARIQKGLSQRELASAAGVPASTIGKIETGSRQPSWPLLCRILAAAELEMRVQLAPYDDHDDILDATRARLSAEQQATEDRTLDEVLARMRVS